MKRKHVLLAAAISLAVLGVRALVACTEITPTTFGNPNTLDRKNIPGEGGVEQIACGASTGGEGGADGGKTFDGGCPSFATDIYPYFAPAGAWRCSDKACHGGMTAPAIAGDNAANCLTSLKAINVKMVPYLLSDGGKDENASSLLCNISGGCGSPMPKAPGLTPTGDDLCKVQAWLRCGAPP